MLVFAGGHMLVEDKWTRNEQEIEDADFLLIAADFPWLWYDF
jgi:hypothetical protein